MTSFIWTNVVKQQSLKESSFVKSERAQIKSKTYFKTFDVLFYRRIVDNERFSLMAFTETGTFNINDGRNANKNYLLSSDSQIDGLCGVRNHANQPWMKTSICRTAHTWKNMIRGSWLDVLLFSHVGKAIRDIWLVYIGLRTKIYSAAFQCVNLSVYIIYTETRVVNNTEIYLLIIKPSREDFVSWE